MTDSQDNFTPTVLVVDDTPLERAAVIEAISKIGVNVVEAEDGKTALKILKQKTVNLIISDLIMPKMSGLMLLHSLLEQGIHLPFIIVTSYSDKESAVQALRLGAFDYLEKPIDSDDLENVAREAISAGREQQQLVTMMNANDMQSRESFALAEMLILRMRTFRAKNGEFNSLVTKGNINNWYDLKNLFIAEAEPQLDFCFGALESIRTSQTPSYDLGFILRIIQSIRLASESIRIAHIAEFAWTLELVIAEFKAEPTNLIKEHIDQGIAGLKMLKSQISNLQNQDAIKLQKALEKVSEELRAKALQARSQKNSA
jgi:CheY-like chemotaxis protein